MESPVTGGITPLSLGELRQAILAVLVGNLLFTEEEQLLANHLSYECEDEAQLATWLRNARREDVKRRREAHLLALNTPRPEPATCYDEQAQFAELAALLQCRALSALQKSASAMLIGDSVFTPATRLRLLGDAYFALLHTHGFEEVFDKRSGLYSN